MSVGKLYVLLSSVLKNCGMPFISHSFKLPRRTISVANNNFISPRRELLFDGNELSYSTAL